MQIIISYILITIAIILLVILLIGLIIDQIKHGGNYR